MPISVSGKVALITGAGSGINLAFARLLLSKNCSVIIADLSLRPESQSLLSQYPHPSPSPKTQPSAIFHRTNVVSWPDLASLWKTALEAFPGRNIDIVVPGAGLFEPKWSSFWEPPRSATNPSSVSRDVADGDPGHYAVLDVNLTAPIRLSQIAIGHWTRNKSKGCLVHVASIAGYSADVPTPLYFASKHGLLGFVRSLGKLRDELGIRVSAVAPGAVKTPMWSEDPTKAAMVDKSTAFIEPEEIAAGMYRLVVDEEFGDGNVLEVTAGATRVVPLYNSPPPSGATARTPGYVDSVEDLLRMLKHGGLKL